MYLIFDTAANGSPKSWKAPVTDTFNWPRMIHISWILLGEDLKPIEDFNCLIKSPEYKITADAAKKHSIELEDVEKKGDKLSEVLDKFNKTVKESKYVFSHNLNYNQNIVGAECIRAKKTDPLAYADSYCLMQEGTFLCKLKGKRGYKWPSLQELHSKIFNQGFSPPNNARADVIAASRCFIAMKKIGHLEDIFDDDI